MRFSHENSRLGTRACFLSFTPYKTAPYKTAPACNLPTVESPKHCPTRLHSPRAGLLYLRHPGLRNIIGRVEVCPTGEAKTNPQSKSQHEAAAAVVGMDLGSQDEWTSCVASAPQYSSSREKPHSTPSPTPLEPATART